MAPENREVITKENMSTAPWRRVGRIPAVRRIALAVVLVLVAPSILFAHAKLVWSHPSAGERLTASPSSIRLVFSETPMVAVSRVYLLGSHGDTLRLGAVHVDRADAHAVVADLIAPLLPGSYAVHWSAAGSDGHASQGIFRFTMVAGPVAFPSAQLQSPESSGGAHFGDHDQGVADMAAFSVPLAIGRWLGFLALFSLIGAVAFRYAILDRLSPPADASDPFAHIASVGAATFGLFAAVVLVISTVIRLYAESMAISDVPLGTMLLHTGWGGAWLAQMLACLVAIIAFRIAHRGRHAGWRSALVCALVLAATPALTGHAIGSDEALFAVPLDILHVLAGSVWVGTLSMIVFVGIGAAAKTPGTIGLGTRVAGMINRFSPIALICGGTVMATGVIASLLRLRPLSRLWTSGYGVTLIVKLAFVVLLFVVGAWNWRRIKPTLGIDAALPPLARSARLELLTGAMVLAVTAILVAMALPD